MITSLAVAELCSRLATNGYYASPEVGQGATAALIPRPDGSVRTLLIEGAPGLGKSSLATAMAKAIDAELIVYQCHDWSDADELFVGIDVPSVVAGNVEGVEREGVLLRASRLSQEKPSILLLDELDKARPRAEALLLDWLQTGRCYVGPGRHVMAKQDNLIVMITSNAMREISPALRRRVRTLRIATMEPRAWNAAVRRMVPWCSSAVVKQVHELVSARWEVPPAPASVAAFLSECLAIVDTTEALLVAWRAHGLPDKRVPSSGTCGTLLQAIRAARGGA